MKKYDNKYAMGIDIGTGSVGMTIIDENYDCIYYHNQPTMISNVFHSASTAQKTREQRGSRRRNHRSGHRIQLLQELFFPHIYKIEPSYFRKMDDIEKWTNSNQFENRSLTVLCKELGIDQKEFPTIYHLRKKLIESNEKMDIRLIYLAIHHMVKNRGHFLTEGTMEGNQEIDVIDELLNIFNSELVGIIVDSQQLKKAVTILRDKTKTRKDRKMDFSNALSDTGPKDKLQMIGGLLLGLKESVKAICDYDKKSKISFSSESWEEILEYVAEEVSDFLYALNNIYIKLELEELLGKCNYICEAKVESYQKHKEDLKWLKNFMYNKDHNEYKEMFVSSKEGLDLWKKEGNPEKLSSYDAYIKQGGKTKNRKKFKDLFFDKVKKQITEADEEHKKDIEYRISLGTFLEKQRSFRNISIPHQLHIKEVKKILENQRKYYPAELNQEVTNKISQIISFRIPYYIGPIVNNTDNSKFSWMEKKKNERVTPWNFDEVVDKEKSAEKFIRRMTNKCSYLLSEDVLPKKSLIYQMYEVLNEINSVNYRPENRETNRDFRFSIDEIDSIIENVFKKNKVVKIAQIYKFLKESGLEKENYRVIGMQKEEDFAASLSSWIDFTKILGREIEEKDIAMIEDIIFALTIYNDKDILETRIVTTYRAELTEKQISCILKLKYSGWGRLSKKLLCGIQEKKNNRYTILDIMKQGGTRNIPMNFMEVITNSNYKFDEIISDMNKEKLSVKEKGKFTYNIVEDLQGSPAIKRAIWQALQMIDEIVEIFGQPKAIGIEVTREDKVIKDRTKARESLWKEMKENKVAEFDDDITDIGITYGNDRLWLYLMQNGKCMYSCESLDIGNLSSYHIDHIIPQSYTDDDSLDNRVLVKATRNMMKSDDKMPLEMIEDSKKSTVISHWKNLHEKKFISDRKYFNLLKIALTEKEKEGFVKRQIVETGQIGKHLVQILQSRFPELSEDNKIQGIKGKLVSGFRKKYGIVKNRDLNHNHHAVDALIVAVLQQFISDEYPKGFRIKDEEYNKFVNNATNTKNNFLLYYLLENNLKEKDIIGKVKRIADFKVILRKKPGVNGDGNKFWKATLLSPYHKDVQSKAKNDMQNYKLYSQKKIKYGYPLEQNYKYMIGIEYLMSKGKKSEYLFVSVSYLQDVAHKSNIFTIAQEFVKEKAKDKEYKILRVKKIMKNQLIEYQGHRYYLIGNKEIASADPLQLSQDIQNEIASFGKESKEINDVEKTIERAEKLIEKILLNINEQYSGNLMLSSTKKNEAEILSEIKEKLVGKMKEGGDFYLDVIKEINKAVGVSGSRSDVLKMGRIEKSVQLLLDEMILIDQSVTGLRIRKRKLFD